MKRAGVLHLITCLLLWFVPGVQHGDEAVYFCIYRNGETRAIGKHAVRLNVSDIQPIKGNSLYLGQPSHHRNCSSNAKDSDMFVFSLHLLVVIVAWILQL
ncbi:PREDICTED: uncharacterized protein LOC109303368 isoform X3 [Gavialis gangeticus]|uniref:uncharacterized protein LOC109303368 isoform X3 n=1 Tax=Gavialis gangeticus TaxID=94835 RepID=UPI00092F1175|nr:PREDICTED: uncharacterized protein LOC109303368 isoform X3 [Gavialis gangeticus]